MTCPATLPGPSRWPCTRTDPHTSGHVYRGDDPDLRRDHEEDAR